MEAVALPDPAAAPALFDGLDAPAERLERLVREAFAIYERGAPELHAIRNEPGASERREGRRGARGLALGPGRGGRGALRIAPANRAVVRAMIDLGTWQALRDQGLGPAEAGDAVSSMLAARAADSA